MTKRNKPKKIGVGTVQIGSHAKKLINETLDKNRLTYGDLTIEFENEFAKAHDSRFGLFTVSGTCALQVALHALKSIHGWRDEDEVLVPAITFIATSNVVLQNNLRPVFVDVDDKTYNIDIEKIEKHITDKTRAIMPVHMFGQSADMEEIMNIAKKYNLKVLVDSCETMGVNYKNKSVGAWGDIACFSTYAAHLVVTGVGGLALTNNPDYATKMRSLMNHGRDTIYYNIDHDDNVDSKDALFSMADKRFSFIDIGYSYRLTELEAAIGLEGLREMPTQIDTRQKNAAFLTRSLEKHESDLQLPYIAQDRDHAFMMYPIVIKKDSSVNRDNLILFLEDNNIETRYMMPLLSQPIYKEIFGNIEDDYPVAKWIDRNGFYIGCHHALSKKDLQYIADTFESFFNQQ